MKPPGPKGSLIWGSFKQFQADPLEFFLNSTRQHGDLVQFRFAHLQAYLVNDPNWIEQVLLVKADNFDKNTRSVKKIEATCGDSLLSSNEQAWQRHRKLIQPVFQPRFVESMVGAIDTATQEMLERWDGICKSGGKIDLVSEITNLVICISTSALFSSDVDPEKLESALSVLLDDTWRRLQSPIDLTKISPRLHRKEFKSAINDIDTTVFDIISRKRTNQPGYDDVLSRLLDAHEENSEIGLSDQELRDAVITLLLAGHETTSNALAWAFYLLASSPEKMPKDGNFTNVFRETLRLYPSIWIIERRVKDKVEIGNFELKKGASVLISPYILHRNPKYWDDPEQFEPDRFLEAEVEKRPRNSYLPFGLGVHRCVGLHMASQISTRVLATVHSTFRLTPLSKPAPDPGITLRHKNQIFCKIEKR